jgi:hypothetical protein
MIEMELYCLIILELYVLLFTGHDSTLRLSREFPDDIPCEFPDVNIARKFPEGKAGQT